MAKNKREARHHPNDLGKTVLMAEADGYVMVRRPGAMPFVVAAMNWRKWREYDPALDPRA